MPVSIIRKHYLLYEAFELTGRRLFGAEWTNNEWAAFPCPSPDQMMERHLDVKKTMAALDGELEIVKSEIARTTNERTIKKQTKKLQELRERRVSLGIQLNIHPEPQESHRWGYGNYTRKLATEKTLVDAIIQGKFKVWGQNIQIEPYLWRERRFFNYDIQLSLVRMPRHLSGKRHHHARIEESEFDAWLETLEPHSEAGWKLLEPRDRAVWFIRKKAAAGGRFMRKEDVYAEAKLEIAKLSKRQFESAWQAAAPAEWRKQGRRHGT